MALARMRLSDSQPRKVMVECMLASTHFQPSRVPFGAEARLQIVYSLSQPDDC